MNDFTEYEPGGKTRRQSEIDYTIIVHKVGRMAENLEAITHTLEHQLSADESRWVKLAIEKESQSIDLRKAIIEKSLTSLVWSAIVGMGYILLAWATSRGFKP
jgi:hypothetical protein